MDDILNNYNDINTPNNTLDCLVYIEGYVGYKVASTCKCENCVTLLIIKKNLTCDFDASADAFIYTQHLNRGGLKYPTQFSTHIAEMAYKIFTVLRGARFEAAFLKIPKQKAVFRVLILELFEEVTLPQCNHCGQSSKSILNKLLSHRFDIINNTIKSYGDETVGVHNVSNYIRKLYVLCRSHFKLCGVAHKLGSNFGFQLLVTSIIMILNFLSQSYCLYALCTQNVTSDKIVKGMAIFTWFLTELLELFGLLVACTDACDNANEAPITLHEVQNKVENSDFESHIQLFSLQMYHHKLVFSALGFFEIDFSLLYAIIGTVLTFLVIVVQFEQSQTATQTVAAVVTDLVNATITTISNDIVGGEYYDDDDYDF
ncbi:hypothetical protein FQR65_LT00727 [Abscondita terminalis]|nr:hypothetical protein FQR65_LT00727 [Abscondita terminalis]